VAASLLFLLKGTGWERGWRGSSGFTRISFPPLAEFVSQLVTDTVEYSGKEILVNPHRSAEGSIKSV
jgi:hypothetical protein